MRSRWLLALVVSMVAFVLCTSSDASFPHGFSARTFSQADATALIRLSALNSRCASHSRTPTRINTNRRNWKRLAPTSLTRRQHTKTLGQIPRSTTSLCLGLRSSGASENEAACGLVYSERHLLVAVVLYTVQKDTVCPHINLCSGWVELQLQLVTDNESERAWLCQTLLMRALVFLRSTARRYSHIWYRKTRGVSVLRGLNGRPTLAQSAVSLVARALHTRCRIRQEPIETSFLPSRQSARKRKIHFKNEHRFGGLAVCVSTDQGCGSTRNTRPVTRPWFLVLDFLP